MSDVDVLEPVDVEAGGPLAADQLGLIDAY
jgi:hypothetical protein